MLIFICFMFVLFHYLDLCYLLDVQFHTSQH
jgi:hypothetical protein